MMNAQLDFENEPPASENPPRRFFSFLMIALVLALALGLNFVQRPRPAAAMPTFAQAYQIDCSACHTMVPALNAYGRYVQSTAFGALDPTTMKRVVPIVVREAISYRSTGSLNAKRPNDKYTYANLSVNLVGVLNKYISYRFEQTLYSNNIGGGNTGHFWVSYNQLLKGDAHVIVGKFDAPAPPAFSYWQDQSGFSSGGIAVGQHAYGLAGDRWGVGFNYVPANYQKTPYKAQLAYVGNSPPIFNASAFSNTNPSGASGAGSDRAFQYKLAYARPDKPVEAGVYGAVGSYILPPAYLQPIDKYNAVGVYAQRDPMHGFPGLLVFYQQTSDSNVGPGTAAQLHTQSAVSRAFAFEVDESLFNGTVMVAIRPVEFLGGLQASKTGFDVSGTARPHFGTFDIVARDPKFSPYVYLTLESALAAASNATFGRPAWRAGLKFAGPLFRAPALAAAPPVTASALSATGAQPATSTSDIAAGQQIYATNCAACHNANGTGGAGPNLHQIATKRTLAQTISSIEKPLGIMPKLYPGTLSDAQVQQVAAYIRATFH